MKTIISIIMLLFTIIIYSNAQQLKLEILGEKQTYFVGEHVQIGISIKNVGSDIVILTNLGYTSINILDEEGNELKYIGSAPREINFSPLKNSLIPNDEDLKIVDLNEFFGEQYNNFITDHYFKKGKYDVVAKFKLYNGITYTKNISFDIVPPINEELIVYNKYVEIMTNEIQHKYTELEVADALQFIYEIYPTSVYIPSVLVMLDAVCDVNLQDHGRASKIREILVNKYPWSVQGRGMLENILKKKSSESERIEYLKKLRDSNKNSLMSKKYDQMIKSKLEK